MDRSAITPGSGLLRLSFPFVACEQTRYTRCIRSRPNPPPRSNCRYRFWGQSPEQARACDTHLLFNYQCIKLLGLDEHCSPNVHTYQQKADITLITALSFSVLTLPPLSASPPSATYASIVSDSSPTIIAKTFWCWIIRRNWEKSTVPELASSTWSQRS